MNKEINEFDRMIIGVREWAFKTVLGDPWVGLNWTEDRCSHSDEEKKIKDRTTEQLFETAKKLEEYVMKGIEDSKGFRPEPGYFGKEKS